MAQEPKMMTAQGQGPKLTAQDSSLDRARTLLRVALSGVQLPFEVFDSALMRSAAILERYRVLDLAADLRDVHASEAYAAAQKMVVEEERQVPVPDVEKTDAA